MAYIGQGIKQGTFKVLDTSGNTYNGSNVTFSLGTQVGSAAQLLVSHDGVIQKPGTDYTLASGGASITFSTAPASGASIFITEISGAVGGTVTPSDTSVTADKLNSALLTGLTDIGAGIADADLFLVDDGAGGTLRKVAASRLSTYISPSTATDSFTINGSTPTLTIGDAGAEDTKIVFDGNAQDFHVGLDDSADSLVIGLGSTLGTTSHIVIDATGAVTKPLQPAFLVKTGSTQSNYATATTHTVQFSSEIFDQNADFDTSTYTFTAPVTGRYQLSCDLKIDDIDQASDYYSAAIVCSNRSIGIFNVKTPYLFSQDSDYNRWVSSCLVDMDANDTAYVTFRPQAGDATADINVNESLFAGFLAC